MDCTAAGQPLCNTHGVRGYPTIKFGDLREEGGVLKDYRGGRDFDTLKMFAETNIKVAAASGDEL